MLAGLLTTRLERIGFCFWIILSSFAGLLDRKGSVRGPERIALVHIHLVSQKTKLRFIYKDREENAQVLHKTHKTHKTCLVSVDKADTSMLIMSGKKIVVNVSNCSVQLINSNEVGFKRNVSITTDNHLLV